MQMLGFEKEDLNTRKTRNQFRDSIDMKTSPTAVKSNTANLIKNLNTIEPEEVDDQLT